MMGIEGFTVFGIPVVIDAKDLFALAFGVVVCAFLLVVLIFNELFLVAFRWLNRRRRM